MEPRWARYNRIRAKRRRAILRSGFCGRCGKRPPEPGKKACLPCLLKTRTACKRWYLRKPKSYHLRRFRKYYPLRDKKARNAYVRRKRKELRLAVFRKYGGRCVCCGEDDIRFLTIDHVNGGGRADNQNSMGFLRKLVRFKVQKNRRLLCYNCNCSRKDYNGICPHKLPRTTRS